jgi:hypothetical protein
MNAGRTKKTAWMIGSSIMVVAIGMVAVSAFASSGGEGLKLVGAGGADSRKCLVVTIHGWIESGQGRWAGYSAEAIASNVDSRKWACGSFDWAKGALTIDPRDAAIYARDTAGVELAREILAIRKDWRHIHLIGHSCGAWVISEAAKILAVETKADIHLTFLDAYVPEGWDAGLLGEMPVHGGAFWAEQYFTRDSTGKVTEALLAHAVNIDITAVDPYFKDHNFPKYWYYATVTGQYPHLWLKWCSTNDSAGGMRYGFARSRECSEPNGWEKSLTLPMGNGEPLKIMP